MCKRSHHQRVLRVLEKMDTGFLRETKCYFGGGTAIALLLDEYRESLDIDFLCGDPVGYRKLRSSVFEHGGLALLFAGDVQFLRNARTDQYGVRTVLSVDDAPVKLEIIREDRIALDDGVEIPGIPVPCLSVTDLFAEKLLANTDRFADKSTLSRDVIDLIVMETRWGPVPDRAREKAASAYGDAVNQAEQKAKDLLRADPRYLDDCLEKLGVSAAVQAQIRAGLAEHRYQTGIEP